MGIFEVLVIISSFSFFSYGVAYFTSSHMKEEFVRFGLAKFGTLTAVLEISGGTGLLVGLLVPPLLLLASGGLAILMLLGVGTRLKVGDPLVVILPAFFFFLLNSYIFFEAWSSL